MEIIIYMYQTTSPEFEDNIKNISNEIHYWFDETKERIKIWVRDESTAATIY